MNNIDEIIKKIVGFCIDKGFILNNSEGTLCERKGYGPFNPSAGHNILDPIIRMSEAIPVKKFVVSERCLREVDIFRVGISPRHLSFFEMIDFAFVGNRELIPKQEGINLIYTILKDILKLDKKRIFVTIFGGANIEGIEIKGKTDEYDKWVELLGKSNVIKTRGRRNFFYVKQIGLPGGTGCEIYYKIRDQYLEISSQVNYAYTYEGTIKPRANNSFATGIGLERLLMALENKSNIFETSLFSPLRQIFIKKTEEVTITELYPDTVNSIIDYIRAVSFVVMDGQEVDSTSRGKVLKKFIKEIYSRLEYLGIDDFDIINCLVEELIKLYGLRYEKIGDSKNKILNIIKMSK